MTQWTKEKFPTKPALRENFTEHTKLTKNSVVSASSAVKNNSVNLCKSVSKKFVLICVHSWLIIFCATSEISV